MRKLTLILSAWIKACLFLCWEKGKCVNQDVYTGGWLGCGINLMNSFGQLKQECSNSQAKECCLGCLNTNLKGWDATLWAPSVIQCCSCLLCYIMRPAPSLIWWYSGKRSWHLFYLLSRLLLLIIAASGSVKDVSTVQAFVQPFRHL